LEGVTLLSLRHGQLTLLSLRHGQLAVPPTHMLVVLSRTTRCLVILQMLNS
jgi:hypothetical protein